MRTRRHAASDEYTGVSVARHADGGRCPVDVRERAQRVADNTMETPRLYPGIRSSSQVGGQAGPRRHGAAPETECVGN